MAKLTDNHIRLKILEARDKNDGEVNLVELSREMGVPLSRLMRIDGQLEKAFAVDSEAVRQSHIDDTLNRLLKMNNSLDELVTGYIEYAREVMKNKDTKELHTFMRQIPTISNAIRTNTAEISKLLGAHSPQRVETRITSQVVPHFQALEERYKMIISRLLSENPEAMKRANRMLEEESAKSQQKAIETIQVVSKEPKEAKLG